MKKNCDVRKLNNKSILTEFGRMVAEMVLSWPNFPSINKIDKMNNLFKKLETEILRRMSSDKPAEFK